MVTINLLPWRVNERAYQLKMLKIVSLVMSGIILGMSLVCYLIKDYQIDYVSTQMTDLRQQIDMHSVRQPSVQHEYSHAEAIDLIIKRLLILLNQTHDEDVCFTSITRAHNRISFVGRTRSATDLTTFLRGWLPANLFTDVQLKRLEHDRQPKLFFHFQASLPENL